MKTRKGKVKQFVEKNPIEQLLDIGQGVISSGADIGTKIADSSNWNEYLGYTETKSKQKRSGDLKEGEELNLKDLQEKEEIKDVDPAIDYVREVKNAAERATVREEREIDVQLREIMDEIKKLADSSKDLQAQFKDVAVEQHVVKPGKYHKTFFSWLLSVIRSARMKVESSSAWLTAIHSKKKARQYGAMAKKFGTSFTLNNERNVATQVG